MNTSIVDLYFQRYNYRLCMIRDVSSAYYYLTVQMYISTQFRFKLAACGYKTIVHIKSTECGYFFLLQKMKVVLLALVLSFTALAYSQSCTDRANSLANCISQISTITVSVLFNH